MSNNQRLNKWRRPAACVLLIGAMACGDSDNGGGGGGGGSPTVPSGSGPGPSGATITIGTNGSVSPSQVTISQGQSVTIINNHTQPHEIASDPHPAHTRCPSINAVGNIPAATTRITNSFTGAGSCGFHDHGDPNNAGLRGTITVQ
jgi:plastocyanin